MLAAGMPLLRGQLRHEPEEVKVASGVVAMRRWVWRVAAYAQAECLRYPGVRLSRSFVAQSNDLFSPTTLRTKSA